MLVTPANVQHMFRHNTFTQCNLRISVNVLCYLTRGCFVKHSLLDMCLYMGTQRQRHIERQGITTTSVRSI